MIRIAFALVLSAGIAYAQRPKQKTPKPTPAPAPTAPAAPEQPAPTPAAPTPPAPVPAPTPPAPTPDTPPEKGTTNTSLQEGGDARPWAAGVAAADQQKALGLFREGNQAHNDGLFAKAVDLYKEALKHWKHPAIYYNMALSLTNLQLVVDVEAALLESIKYGPAPLEKGKFEHAKQSLILIAEQLATIEVSCQKPGAVVTVDNKKVFIVETGKPNTYKARVKIGKHTFVAEKPGYATGLDAPFIGAGETFRIELKLYTAEELTRHRRRWKARWMPYAVLGGAVAIGATGFFLSRSAQSSFDEYDDKIRRCNDMSGNNGGCMISSDLTDIKDSGESKRTASYVMYGVAGAAAVTGALLLFLNRSQPYQISSDEYRREQLEKERATQKVTITPIIAPTMAGAMLDARF